MSLIQKCSVTLSLKRCLGKYEALHCSAVKNESVHFCIAINALQPHLSKCPTLGFRGVILCIPHLLPHCTVLLCAATAWHLYCNELHGTYIVMNCNCTAPGIKTRGVIQCIGDVPCSGRLVCEPFKQPLLLLNISYKFK